MVHCGDELLTTDEINADIDKIIGYESPITKIYEDIAHQLAKQDDENCMYAINQTVGYAVDKEELIKALQYDRNQYQKGYEDAMSVIEDIQAEIDDEWYRVKRDSYERAEGLELASEIIIKHTSGAKMEDEE